MVNLTNANIPVRVNQERNSSGYLKERKFNTLVIDVLGWKIESMSVKQSRV